MFAAFVMSVIVQYNDPDPMMWVLMYGAAALACFLMIKDVLQWWIYALVGTVALIWAGFLSRYVIGQVAFFDMFEAYEMKSLAVEQAREMGGLLIIALWMAVLAIRSNRET